MRLLLSLLTRSSVLLEHDVDKMILKPRPQHTFFSIVIMVKKGCPFKQAGCLVECDSWATWWRDAGISRLSRHEVGQGVSYWRGGLMITGVVIISIPSSTNCVSSFSNLPSNGTATSCTEMASVSLSSWFLFSLWMALVRFTRNLG